MAIKNVIRMGNEKLYHFAKPVTQFDTPELHSLITDLFDTMHATGGVGIAAPQIGVSLQVAVFGFETSKRYSHAKPVPKTVLINPSFEPLSDEIYEDWEGCLSVRVIRGLVSRYEKIRYRGYDQFGNLFEREVEGFHARLVQHEYDHLIGKLFPFRIQDMRYFGFEEEIIELMQQVGNKLD